MNLQRIEIVPCQLTLVIVAASHCHLGLLSCRQLLLFGVVVACCHWGSIACCYLGPLPEILPPAALLLLGSPSPAVVLVAVACYRVCHRLLSPESQFLCSFTRCWLLGSQRLIESDERAIDQKTEPNRTKLTRFSSFVYTPRFR